VARAPLRRRPGALIPSVLAYSTQMARRVLVRAAAAAYHGRRTWQRLRGGHNPLPIIDSR